ncbi:MAG TPA: TonB family protein [Vicinamibacterales bacterium]|nr:TonB family protein [Vicinamibacterales bacterium]
MDAVSEVLIARTEKGDSLNSMLGASAAAHLVLLLLFVFLPAAWFGAENKEPETIMQISLGGPVGPDVAGLNVAGARPIQQVTESPKSVEPVRPPAAKTPEMVLPTKAPPKKTTPNKIEAKDPRSTRPTKGAEVVKGSAVADTGARGQGFGLSSGMGGEGGYLEVGNFCCPEYLATMRSAIMSNWNSRQGAAGRTHMRFVIQRDGRIADISVQRSSGVQVLDYYAQRALMLTKLPPLPAGYDQPVLAVHLYFDYQR